MDPDKYVSRKEYVLDIAEHKVADVFDDMKKRNSLPDVLIGADTIVELNNRIFGKPKDKPEAAAFLNM